MDLWLDEKTGESGISVARRPIRSATQVGYRQHVRDYLKPHLGHILLSKLSSEDISRAYRKIMAESAEKVAKAVARATAVSAGIAERGGEEPPAGVQPCAWRRAAHRAEAASAPREPHELGAFLIMRRHTDWGPSSRC
jgi:hypothetical protein